VENVAFGFVLIDYALLVEAVDVDGFTLISHGFILSQQIYWGKGRLSYWC
jgi:hypothetical protein